METIEDIVREMRGQGGDSGYPLDIKRYADRIEAVYKHHLTKGEMCTMSCRESGALLEQYADSEKRLANEVKRLRDALKSVQGCYAPTDHLRNCLLIVKT